MKNTPEREIISQAEFEQLSKLTVHCGMVNGTFRTTDEVERWITLYLNAGEAYHELGFLNFLYKMGFIEPRKDTVCPQLKMDQ